MIKMTSLPMTTTKIRSKMVILVITDYDNVDGDEKHFGRKAGSDDLGLITDDRGTLDPPSCPLCSSLHLFDFLY